MIGYVRIIKSTSRIQVPYTTPHTLPTSAIKIFQKFFFRSKFKYLVPRPQKHLIYNFLENFKNIIMDKMIIKVKKMSARRRPFLKYETLQKAVFPKCVLHPDPQIIYEVIRKVSTLLHTTKFRFVHSFGYFTSQSFWITQIRFSNTAER